MLPPPVHRPPGGIDAFVKMTTTGLSFAGKTSVTLFFLRLTLNETGGTLVTSLGKLWLVSKTMLSKITSATAASVMVIGEKPRLRILAPQLPGATSWLVVPDKLGLMSKWKRPPTGLVGSDALQIIRLCACRAPTLRKSSSARLALRATHFTERIF